MKWFYRCSFILLNQQFFLIHMMSCWKDMILFIGLKYHWWMGIIAGLSDWWKFVKNQRWYFNLDRFIPGKDLFCLLWSRDEEVSLFDKGENKLDLNVLIMCVLVRFLTNDLFPVSVFLGRARWSLRFLYCAFLTFVHV